MTERRRAEFRVPRDPREAYEQCLSTLEFLHSFANEVVEDIRVTRSAGALMTRKQSSEFNRACQMARYASDCLVASRWNIGGRSGEKRRKLGALGIDGDMWSPRER